MKPRTSESGAPILTGTGLQSVRERIRQAFQVIHKDMPLNEREIEIVEVTTLDVAPDPPKVLRPLSERADPILRVAERRFQHAVGRKHHHSAVNHISVPTETVDELIRQAIVALGDKE
jgi:hypothetical protein